MTAIAPGEELLLDYPLVTDEPADGEARLGYVCRCGAVSLGWYRSFFASDDWGIALDGQTGS